MRLATLSTASMLLLTACGGLLGGPPQDAGTGDADQDATVPPDAGLDARDAGPDVRDAMTKCGLSPDYGTFTCCEAGACRGICNPNSGACECAFIVGGCKGDAYCCGGCRTASECGK